MPSLDIGLVEEMASARRILFQAVSNALSRSENVIEPLVAADIPELLGLWSSVPGLGLGPDDEESRLAAFLARNPTTCLGLFIHGHLVGCVLGGFDGRRGYLYHLAVHPDHQKKGYGRALLDRVSAEFQAAGVSRIRLFVFGANRRAREFYQHLGWRERDDLVVVAKDL